MKDYKSLEQLRPVADEMLAGLHADEAMKRRIIRAAQGRPSQLSAKKFVPALCCAALVFVCVGAVGTRMQGRKTQDAQGDQPQDAGTIAIQTIAAGDGLSITEDTLVADLGTGANVSAVKASGESLFASSQGDIPLVALNGAVYHMLTAPQDMGSSLLGDVLGSVKTHAQEPSLASSQEMEAGLSNVVAEGTSIYAVKGVASSTAIAAEVDGHMRLFQRVSYAGQGPGGLGLEDTFSVRDQVKTLELSGVGTLSGDAANAAIAVLLDQAMLKSADATARKQTLTVTLTNGLKLQLGVSGDTLCGCGGWSCPEFFEAFEAAL